MGSVEVPKQYKAAVYDQPGKISTKVEELDIPEPGPGEVLIKLTHSGVCHSDLGVMTCSWKGLPYPTPKGQVGGHEGVGKIVKLGPGAESQGVKLDQRVGIKWMAGTCGNCPACLEGHDAVCFNGKISGYYTPGTFQQYVTSPANYVTPIPDGLESAEAAPMLCAGVTVYSALRKSGAQSGQWVALLGAGGGLGHIAVQLAAKGMALRVIGVDAPEKKQLVLDSGAEHFIGLGEGDPVKKVQELTGGLGVQACLVLTAANAAYASAPQMIKFGGRVVCVGLPEGEMQAIATAYPQKLIAMAQSIVGVAVGSRKEAIETLEMASRGIVKTHYAIKKMEDLTNIFEDMNAGKLQGRVVLDLS
jgi:propanol-preferring alcohol dehydrogenase